MTKEHAQIPGTMVDLAVFTGLWMAAKQAAYSGYWTMELMYDHFSITGQWNQCMIILVF